jgi:hypothetical protein
MWVMWKLVLVRLEIVLTLMQYVYTVCAERTRGSKIVLDVPNGTPRCWGSLESHLSPFGDRFGVDAR